MQTDLCQTLTQKHLEYAQYSGHFFTELGDIEDCVDLPYSSTYFLANFNNNRTNRPASMYLGLCLPSQCSTEYITTVINEQLVKTNPMIQAILGFPLTVGSVNVNPQSTVYKFSGWFYFTLILLTFLVLLGLFAVVKGQLRKKKEKSNGVNKIIQTFNYQDSLKIFTYKHSYLNIFNGIKTICMCWVIFGHLFSVRLHYNVNLTGIPTIVEEFFFCFVTGAFLAVDVFFFIGGFLVAYSFMREKSKSMLKYPMAVLHRLLRFWPSYIMVILIYYGIQMHTGSGPLWETNMNTIGQIPDCSGAWKTLLFVDNLVDNGEHMCLPWGWYLQNDMQIFVFSLVFILIYVKNRKAGFASILLMIIIGLSINIYEVVHREIKQVTHLIDFIKWNQYFTCIYIKPWIRCPPYLFGLIMGLLHMEYLQVKKKLIENPDDQSLNSNFFVRIKKLMLKRRWIVWASQFFGVVLMITTIILPHDMQRGNTWPFWAHGVYLSFEKISFTMGVYFLILPTLLEIPTISFFLLDTKFFNFSGKIAFWVYLMHLMVVENVCFGEKVDFYYSPQTVIPLYFGIVCVSFILGFLGTMIVQVPFSKLQKMLFSIFLKKKDRPKVTQNVQSIVHDINSKSILTETDPQTLKNTSTLISNDQLQERLLSERTSIQQQD